jgi:hypothetical protein
MSPKKITRIASIIGAISLLGVPVMAVTQPNWGVWAWWPALGLALTMLLLGVSFAWGAYLSAQQRVELVDLLNDCYTGNTQTSEAETSVAR